MKMRFNLLHRKLLNDTDDQQQGGSSTVPKPCAVFCDAQQNPIGLCPPLCVSFCDAVCKEPPPLVLPDAPPPITVTPVISHSKHFSPSLFLEISLAVLVTGFLCLTCYAIYSLCTRRRVSRTRRSSSAREINQERDADEFEGDYGPVLDHPIWYIRTIGLQPSVIGSISIVRFKKGDGLVEGTDCSICLTEFEEDESIRLLPKCSHAFHVPCIDTWLRSHTNCPMCRAPIVSSSSIVVPQQELVVVDSSNSSEETREGGSSNSDGDIRNESSDHDGTIGVSERDDRVSFKIASENLTEHDCNNSDGGGLDGIRNLRRSFSSDSLSPGVIKALSGNSDADKPVEDKQSSSSGVNKNRNGSKLVSSARSPSMDGFTAQRESCSSSSVKRSASCVFLPRYGSRKQ